jgi:predicted nucleic acid-binding protein
VILVDTNVLVALALPKDRLHARATKDLERLASKELCVLLVVLTEACFILDSGMQRARLFDLLVGTRARQVAEPSWDRVFAWLEVYADHKPDWVDACLVVMSSRDQRVWTYDAEFRTVWRRPDGTRVPLAIA